jgi:hypothetical protein
MLVIICRRKISYEFELRPLAVLLFSVAAVKHTLNAMLNPSLVS